MRRKEGWQIGAVEVIDVPESFGKIFKLTDVTLTCPKKDAETVHIKGKQYIAWSFYYIWHYMYDVLVQYFYLKKHIKDLNFWTFIPHELEDGTKEDFFRQLKRIAFHNKSDKDLDPYPHKYFEDIINIIATQDYFYTTNNHNLIFDEVYLCFDANKVWTTDPKMRSTGRQWFGVNNTYWFPENWEEKAHRYRVVFNETWWRDIGMLEMKKLFLEKIKDYPTDTPKKLFISRKDSLARHSLLADKTAARRHPMALEETVEKCFVDAGYTLVTLEGMGYLEQINLFRNATHISGVVGSGFCQTFMCGPNVIVAPIYVNNNYDFSYDFIAKNMGAKLVQIDIRPIMGNKQKIEECLNKHINYMDMFIESVR